MWTAEYRAERDHLKTVYQQFYQLSAAAKKDIKSEVKQEKVAAEQGNDGETTTTCSSQETEASDRNQTSQETATSQEITASEDSNKERFETRACTENDDIDSRETDNIEDTIVENIGDDVNQENCNDNLTPENGDVINVMSPETDFVDGKPEPNAIVVVSPEIKVVRVSAETNDYENEIAAKEVESAETVEGQESDNASQESKKKKVKSKPGFYKCPSCPMETKKLSAFHRHMTKVHNFYVAK